MKRLPLIFILLTILICSCSAPWKVELVASGSQDDMIRNCVIDFMHSSFAKKDTFDAYRIIIYDEQFEPGVSILVFRGLEKGSEYLWYGVDTVGSVSSTFYKKYLECGNKLFVWRDDDSPIIQEILDKLNEREIINNNWKYEQYIESGYDPADWDSLQDKIDYDFMVCVDDRFVKHANYYVCDNNFLRYKRDITERRSAKRKSGVKCK